jgi:hypothetical protein
MAGTHARQTEERMAGPTGIIPEEYFTPAAKSKVLAFLRGVPAPADAKRTWLLGWAMWVGVKLRGKDYDAVERSGIDNV